jgi:hypothetical protein
MTYSHNLSFREPIVAESSATRNLKNDSAMMKKTEDIDRVFGKVVRALRAYVSRR